MEDTAKRDIGLFKRVQNNMIATNDRAYTNWYDTRRYVEQTRDYSSAELEEIIKSGSLDSQKTLSQNYYYKDGYYKRIILYYATLLTYDTLMVPVVTPSKKITEKAISKKYYEALNYLDLMDLKTLLPAIALRVFRDGSYCGLKIKTDKKHFSVLDLPSNYSCSRFKDLNNRDIIEFNVRYFNTIRDKDTRKQVLALYPKEVQQAYKKYSEGKRKSSWVFLPAEDGIYFDLFDGRPMFLSVIPQTIRYNDAVELELEKRIEEIKKIIVQKVPHNASTDALVFEPDEAEEMHKGAVGMLTKNKNTSVLTTYCDVDAITSNASSDNVNSTLEKMLNNVYSQAGVSSQIFAATGTQSLDTSIRNDLSLVMILGKKFSIFISNILNDLFGNINISFSAKVLPLSEYNRKDYIDSSFKLAQSGYSLLIPAIASGVAQRELTSIKDLENTLLNLGEKLLPLESSYTQSSGEVGAPEKSVEEKSPKTIQNEESLNNQGSE